MVSIPPTCRVFSKTISENSDKKYTMDGLPHKIRKGSLDFNDVEFFAKLLGYEIVLRKYDNQH